MINHDHKFIFVHIPRTSGTSIEEHFGYNGDAAWWGGDGKKHYTLNQYKKELKDIDFKHYFKFSIVRNPWDIIISKYMDIYWFSHKFKKGVPISERGGAIGYHATKSLKYFLDHYQPIPHEHGDGLLDYFDPSQMDFVGRFENRDRDLEYISDKIGIEIDTNTRARVDPEKKHYTEYYDDETRDIVAERYARDIEYFGYEFGE